MACWGLLLCFVAEGFGQVQPALAAHVDAEETLRATPIPPFDILQADAFIEEVFTSLDVEQYAAAAQAYLTLLAQLDRPLSTTEQAVLIKHLRPVAMVLPAAEWAEMGLDEALAQADLTRLQPGSGARLTQWWRSQDTLPATEDNERVEEHLTRIAFAAKWYRDEDDERGFDDRGEVYVRLGTPSHNASVEIRDANLLINPFVSQLPKNAFWVYKHVGHDAHYLFLKRSPNSPYELGVPTDLIPSDLRAGTRKSALLLHVMEEIFVQLALQHPNFGLYYDAVAGYRMLPPHNAGPPHLFALRTFNQASAEDRQHKWNRLETVPPSHSETFGQAGALDVSMRWARFLDPDGTTRTEVYWSLEARALKPSRRLVRRLKKEGYKPSDEYLLSLAVAQQTADYHYRAINKKHYLVPADTEEMLPVKTLVVHGDTATYHLAMQWDQQWTRAGEEKSDALLPGPRLKLKTQRLDTLRALHNQGFALEMSDLKPLLSTQEEPLDTDSPYPYNHLTPATPLAFYFELYHLTYAADDQTHYTIEYEVTRNKKKGGLLRLPGRGDDHRTTAQTPYTGDSRTVREFIALDFSNWQGRGYVDITIRATDETTGATVTRTLTFEMESER